MESRVNKEKKEKQKKKSKVLKWLNHIATVVLFGLLIGMLGIVIISKASGGEPEVFGYQFKTVLSGSMEPGIQTGSVIAVKPGGDMTRFEEGDVITFMDDQRRLITHRVVEVVQSGDNHMYRTKGDNNEEADSDLVLSGNVVAEYSGFTIPYLGYFINFAQSQNGAFLMLIPGLLLLAYAGFTFWRVLSQVDFKKEKEVAEE
ncbi:signal peptidase I SipW [Salirhabdus sp. Marseille-P4669]|uniref:signal peptidase I SipW n=1 Tax=Salirhabdus sp. Marseille-P4669 TaxID=2042310 RepID=UPI000C7B2486|nr:signal peptidase I [Salirhabdus sp. Marseille-P4669]